MCDSTQTIMKNCFNLFLRGSNGRFCRSQRFRVRGALFCGANSGDLIALIAPNNARVKSAKLGLHPLCSKLLKRLTDLEATRRLREYPELDNVPIVALSGHATPEFHHAALVAGCDDCFFKPIDFDQLENLINRLFHTLPQAA